MRLIMVVSLPQRPSSIGEARNMLAVLLSPTNADERACEDLAVLISEACANVVQHGDVDAPIDLRVEIEASGCVLEVGNRGRVPNGGRLPTRLPGPAQPTGRGLPLIAALSDSAEFVVTTPGYVLLRMTLDLRAGVDIGAADPFGP